MIFHIIWIALTEKNEIRVLNTEKIAGAPKSRDATFYPKKN